ncbi:MAG: hypothetical protein QOI20_3372 [Acidimicrobiaceae bacterium]|jgi:hypothetical protein|nr:hypothetical protein [Acidimicrobiaceae bacterium]
MDPLSYIQPPLSYVVFGALGGLFYILRQKVMRHKIAPVEYLARPVFGAVSAYVLTVSLHLPNHLTSLFSGYFGIDVFDAIASRVNVKGLAFLKHVPADQPPAALPPLDALPESDDKPPQT